jgi:hypothetical protein
VKAVAKTDIAIEPSATLLYSPSSQYVEYSAYDCSSELGMLLRASG